MSSKYAALAKQALKANIKKMKSNELSGKSGEGSGGEVKWDLSDLDKQKNGDPNEMLNGEGNKHSLGESGGEKEKEKYVNPNDPINKQSISSFLNRIFFNRAGYS